MAEMQEFSFAQVASILALPRVLLDRELKASLKILSDELRDLKL